MEVSAAPAAEEHSEGEGEEEEAESSEAMDIEPRPWEAALTADLEKVAQTLTSHQDHFLGTEAVEELVEATVPGFMASLHRATRQKPSPCSPKHRHRCAAFLQVAPDALGSHDFLCSSWSSG